MDAERRARALEGRDEVSARADEVVAARAAAIMGAHELAARLRPSGGIARELRERPLRAIGLLVLAGLAGLRWIAGTRGEWANDSQGLKRAGGGDVGEARRHDDRRDRRRGVAAAFVSGIAGAAAERGGRAVVDALFEERSEGHRQRGEVDGSAADADDASGRVAKR